MDSSYWIDQWKKSKNFRVEHDRIKPKSYLFSCFPKTNLYGFQDANIRPVLIGDFFQRYQRMAGYNVLYPVGFDSLGLTSYIENKRHSNTINDDISLIFEEQMLELGIGIDEQKKIDLKHGEFLGSLQLAFIELYEKGYIAYDFIDVYQDKAGKKIFDSYFYKKGLAPNKIKAFYLDISSFQDRIIENIKLLPVKEEIKTTLLSMLEPKESITISFAVSNGTKITYNFKDPEYLGGISFIAIHPDQMDFMDYVLYEEYSAIEKYLSDDNTNDFGVFTGNYAINPLTGKKIPIFVSVKYDCPIYIANPFRNGADRITAQEEGLPIIDVIQNGVFIESDFLNGVSEEEGHKLIIEQFVSAEIGEVCSYYSKDKILLSSLDTFGALIPFFVDNDEKLYSLKEHLPFVLSPKFRPVLSEDIDILGNVMNGSINHIFSSGMLPLLSILYDDIGASSSIFSREAISMIQSWNGVDVLTIQANELFESVFVPLCFRTIVEKEKKVKLPSYCKKLIMVHPVYDEEYHKISRSNNNLLDFSSIIKKYSGDALRLYFLSKNFEQDFIYNEPELASMKNLCSSIEECYKNPFVKDNPLKGEFDEFILSMEQCLKEKNITEYVNTWIQFFKTKVWGTALTSKQGLILLKLIYPVCPFLAEEVYQTIYHGKYLISDDGWI